MQGFRRVLAGLAIAATLATGAACAPMGDIVGADHDESTHDVHSSQVPENVAPYCQYDPEIPGHITVAGPAGGKITVDTVPAGTLVKIEGDYASEVLPDAGGFGGILYNVPGPVVFQLAVDGIECETT